MLALPWRRFDRDLGRGKGGGLEVCGRTLAVQDVSNSDEGTGLFTWVSLCTCVPWKIFYRTSLACAWRRTLECMGLRNP